MSKYILRNAPEVYPLDVEHREAAEISVTQGTPSDADAIYNLVCESFRVNIAPVFAPFGELLLQRIVSRDQIEQGLADPHSTITLTARENSTGILVGVVQALRRSPCNSIHKGSVYDKPELEPHAQVLHFYVLPSHQGRKIGSTLNFEIESMLRRDGAGLLWMRADGGNRRSIHFWGARGYKGIPISTSVIGDTSAGLRYWDYACAKPLALRSS